MTTLTFLGSHVSYQPSELETSVDNENTLKYRGVSYTPRQPIAAQPGEKGLQFKGVKY